MQYKVSCPLCNQEHIEDCEGCVMANEVVCWNSMKDGIPEIIDLNEYGMKWQPIQNNTSSGGKATEFVNRWESADRLAFDNCYNTNICLGSRIHYHIWKIACATHRKRSVSTIMLSMLRQCGVWRLDCIEKVPWLEGRPDRLVWLDDAEALKTSHIEMKGSKCDYYVHFSSCRSIVVERRDEGRSRMERAITQIRNTIRQLRNQGYGVDKAVIIAERVGKPEDGVYGVMPDDSHEVYTKTSPSRKRVLIEGVNLLFYRKDEVDKMRTGAS